MLYVDDMIFTEIHRLLGVDIDHAHGPAICAALQDVQSVLEPRWADGASLAMVDLAERAEAEANLTNELSMKAAERAGCEITGTVPDDARVPLEVDVHVPSTITQQWLHHPADVHDGTAPAIRDGRQHVLDAAYAAHPARFTRPPAARTIPCRAWINKPATANQTKPDRIDRQHRLDTFRARLGESIC